jgi:hypothetical protein
MKTNEAPQVNEPPPQSAPIEANTPPSTPVAANRTTTTIAKQSPAPAPAPQPPKESALSREMRSLDGAKALLERGDAQGTLAALDRHDREFPGGSLRMESAMLRVEALLAKGDESGAKARARDLLAKDPNGPHSKRLRTIVDR